MGKDNLKARLAYSTVGQLSYVVLGASVASIYATDFAEVRLPVHDEELAFLNLPLDVSAMAAAVDASLYRNRR